MKQNPYTPVSSVDSASTADPVSTVKTGRPQDHAAGPWRRVAPHLLGLLVSLLGFAAWFVLWTIPPVHPAYGGPDPARVLLLLLGLTIACGGASVAMAVHSVYAKRFLRLLYVTPPISFVGFMAFIVMRVVRSLG